ncbi:MAG TPA: PilX N-terminal domain-containing pilus assembly protein [Thermoanaerobaculia bacterium]|nr:PilX N-terminal domain-containing pilus assembly protein [Thermoanaerobaculia bacterium]
MSRPSKPGCRRDAGSAYVVVLLVLLVLTTMALALIFVSLTEMRIGANERTGQRSLAAAEAGVGMALARMLVNADYAEGTWIVNDHPDATPSRIGSSTEVGPLVPLIEAPCTLCEINQAGTYGSTAFSRVNVAATAWGRRGGGSLVVGERVISATLDVQPIQVPTSAYFALAEHTSAELAEKVRF